MTVLSQSLKKQEGGVRLGSDHNYATSDPATFEQSAVRFDLVVNTRETQEMLDICGEHGIGAEMENFATDRINAPYEQVLAADVRDRFLIDAATLGDTPTTTEGRPRASRGRPSVRYPVSC
jgi:alcohol dehydrogenase (NADP+)